LLDLLRERRTLHQFHNEVVRADIVKRADVRMIEGRDCPGLALKAFAESCRGNLYGDIPPKPWIAGGRGRDIDLSLPPAQTRAGAC